MFCAIAVWDYVILIEVRSLNSHCSMERYTGIVTYVCWWWLGRKGTLCILNTKKQWCGEPTWLLMTPCILHNVHHVRKWLSCTYSPCPEGQCVSITWMPACIQDNRLHNQLNTLNICIFIPSWRENKWRYISCTAKKHAILNIVEWSWESSASSQELYLKLASCTHTQQRSMAALIRPTCHASAKTMGEGSKPVSHQR